MRLKTRPFLTTDTNILTPCTVSSLPSSPVSVGLLVLESCFHGDQGFDESRWFIWFWGKFRQSSVHCPAAYVIIINIPNQCCKFSPPSLQILSCISKLVKISKQTHYNLRHCLQLVQSTYRKLDSPLILIRDLVDPGRRLLANEAQVVVGTGGGLVRQVGGKERRPVVGDDHDVVLRHVDGRGQLEVTCEGRRRRIRRWIPMNLAKFHWYRKIVGKTEGSENVQGRLQQWPSSDIDRK